MSVVAGSARDRSSVLHHAPATRAGPRAADYALWAVYRQWQGGNARSHALIAPYLRSERVVGLTEVE